MLLNNINIIRILKFISTLGIKIMAIEQNDRSFNKIFEEIDIQTIPPKYIQGIIITLVSGQQITVSEEMLDSIRAPDDIFAGIEKQDVFNVDIALDYDAIQYDVSRDVKSVLDRLFESSGH
jgi:hypothetical protein